MSSQIRIVCLGTGGIAAKHTRYFKDREDVQIVAGCDVSTDQVHSLWERTWEGDAPDPLPEAFTDAAEMYAKTQPDAVVICTPHTLHYEQSIQALDAGCHVLMEKPMVTSAPHAYALRDKVAESGKVFLVAFNTPCSPEMLYIRNCIQQETYGKLQVVSGFIAQDWFNLTEGLWRRKPELSGGGMAYDSGAHLLCSLMWTVQTPIAEVSAFVDNHGTEVDINSAFSVRFENGVIASIAIGGNCQANRADLHYMFENGRIDVDAWHASWMDIHEQHQKVKYPPVTADMDAMPPARNFIESIQGKAQPRATVDDGIIHSELMDAIYESANTGQIARPKRG